MVSEAIELFDEAFGVALAEVVGADVAWRFCCSSRASTSTRSVEGDRFQRNVDLPGLLVRDLERG
jgi:hypothetical protein